MNLAEKLASCPSVGVHGPRVSTPPPDHGGVSRAEQGLGNASNCAEGAAVHAQGRQSLLDRIPSRIGISPHVVDPRLAGQQPWSVTLRRLGQGGLERGHARIEAAKLKSTLRLHLEHFDADIEAGIPRRLLGEREELECRLVVELRRCHTGSGHGLGDGSKGLPFGVARAKMAGDRHRPPVVAVRLLEQGAGERLVEVRTSLGGHRVYEGLAYAFVDESDVAGIQLEKAVPERLQPGLVQVTSESRDDRFRHRERD